MASLYLGKISGTSGGYEIHALTKALPFREYPASEIADAALFQQMIAGRYRLLENGQAIYCTAIHPDTEKKIETNPHDSREGAVHVCAVDETGGIECAVSVAVDVGHKDKGAPIGLPLENRWQQNGYPEGASLDPFRQKYLPSIYNANRQIAPFEMCELYRHFRRSVRSDVGPRLAVYTGCLHLLVREAIKKGKEQTWLWVFDAIPTFFRLYKFMGGVLRDLTIAEHPRMVSPGKKVLETRRVNGLKSFFYRGDLISRHVRTPIPSNVNGSLEFTLKDVPFLDGLVDCNQVERAVVKNPLWPSFKNREGFSWNDKLKRRLGLGIAAKRIFDEDAPGLLATAINKWALKKAGLAAWDFNHVGSLKDCDDRIKEI